MDTRSSVESIEDRLAIVRCIIDDANPKMTYCRIVILTREGKTRFAFETTVSWSGRYLVWWRVQKHWRLDHDRTPLAEWIEFGSVYDDAYRLAVTKPGQVYICRSTAPEESIPASRPDILPILTAILGKISDTSPSDWTFCLYDRLGSLLAEILEEVRRDYQKT